jgi:hypothetical protein
LEQVYANIKYEVNCPNSKDCNNKGAYLEQYQCGEIRDEETGEIIDIDWDLQPCQCQFCYENKSSVFNGGTVGVFDVQGLIETFGPFDVSPIELRFDGIQVSSYNKLSDMHGKRVVAFKQVEAKENARNQTKELFFDFAFEGRCIGRCIFNRKGQKHDIDLSTFKYLYFPAFEKQEGTEYHVNLSLGLS